ncbi:MAG: tetratricopeptide repeat protein [Methanoregula sp.]|nr:tetratricopeptide repeat protein [Methanoregula sp.]
MDDARAWYISGISLQAENRHQEALLAFEQSLVLDPGNAGAWNGKGIALAHLFENAEAIQAFDRALALKPDDSRALNRKHYAEMKAGSA